MTDPTSPTPDPTPGDDRAKLPPRSGDWQSGLKKSEAAAKAPTPAAGTVSDFIASGHKLPESAEWDPVTAAAHSAPPVAAPPAAAAGPAVRLPRRLRIHSFYNSSTRFTDLLIALLLAVAAFASVALSYRGIGHSWDEALYLKPAERAAAWMQGVINSGDDTMLRKEAVDRHWGTQLTGHDPLHPEVAPVPKLLPGAGLTYLKEPLQVDEMTAMRLPNAALFGLTVALLFLLGTREYGRIAGFGAALFYVLMPRVFGHAHIAASETPLAFFTVLTVWCFLVGNRFWPFALFTGIAFGFAIATKVTALALPLPLILWGQLYKRREYASNVFAMLVVAPAVALVLWPWLWYDSFARFVNYLGFYLEHQKTAVYYLGRIWGYGSPTAPLTYPLHITAVALPEWLLFFLALGLLRAVFSTISRPVSVLFALLAIFWISLSMMPNAPRYDGERLWFPAFAFIALLAGGGFSLLFGRVRKWRERRDVASAHRETGYVAALSLLVIAIYGAGDLYFTHPNELNYFNWIAGRAKGAYDDGFETSYWGEAVNDDVTAYLSQITKPGDKVKVLALNDEAFENLRQWGKLPEKVDFSPDAPPYDFAVLQVRQGFMRGPERRLWRAKKPLRVFEANGVPRIMVFDAKAIADVFPAPPATGDDATSAAQPLAVPEEAGATTGTIASAPETTSPLAIAAPDGSTTATEALTTATLPRENTTTSGAHIAPVASEITTVAATRARDFQTTETAESAATAERSTMTTAPAVLDLSTTPASLTPEPGSDAPDQPTDLRQPDLVTTTAALTLPTTTVVGMEEDVSSTHTPTNPVDMATSQTLAPAETTPATTSETEDQENPGPQDNPEAPE